MQAKTPGPGIQDKAIWPGERRQAASRGILPGDAAYLPAQQAKAKMAELQARLDRLKRQGRQPVAASHPVVKRSVRLLQERRR